MFYFNDTLNTFYLRLYGMQLIGIPIGVLLYSRVEMKPVGLQMSSLLRLDIVGYGKSIVCICF